MKSLLKIAGVFMMLILSTGFSMVSAQHHHHKHGKGHYKKVAYYHGRPSRHVYYREPVRHRYYRPVVHHAPPVRVYPVVPRPPSVAIIINP